MTKIYNAPSVHRFIVTQTHLSRVPLHLLCRSIQAEELKIDNIATTLFNTDMLSTDSLVLFPARPAEYPAIGPGYDTCISLLPIIDVSFPSQQPF
jgi:hypothetical protein